MRPTTAWWRSSSLTAGGSTHPRNSGSSSRTGSGGSAALVLLAALGIAAATSLLFTDRLREFADESENLLGGLLLVQGYRLYADYFTSHMPLLYYVSAIPSLLGARSLEEYRWFSNALFVTGLLAIAFCFRDRLPRVVLLIWVITAIAGQLIFRGHMLLAGNGAAFGVALVGLVFFSTPQLEFSRLQQVLISTGIFVAVQSSLLSLFALGVLGATYGAVTGRRVFLTRDRRELQQPLVLLSIILLPHVVLLAGMAAVGALDAFVYDTVTFNREFYSQFVMNPNVVGLLRDWQAQYRVYLFDSLVHPTAVDWFLVLFNVAAAILVYRAAGGVEALVYYVFVGLTRMRNEGSYYFASFFSVALVVGWAARAGYAAFVQRSRHKPIVFVGVALVLAMFGVFFTRLVEIYDISGRSPPTPPYVAIIRALTKPDEPVFVAPFDPYYVLASDRPLATKYPYFLPWHAADPNLVRDLETELLAVRPPIIIWKALQPVNGQWYLAQYGAEVLRAIESSYDYLSPPGTPVTGNILVRRDRIAEARAIVEQRWPQSTLRDWSPQD